MRQGRAAGRRPLSARRLLLWPLVGIVTLPLWALLLHAGTSFAHLPPGSGATTAISVLSSLCALLLTFLAGLPLAWWAASAPQRSQRLLELLLAVPLLLPPLVLGLVLAYVFGPTTAFGTWLTGIGIGVTNSFLGLTIAGFYEAAPFFIYAAWAAFDALDRLEEKGILAVRVAVASAESPEELIARADVVVDGPAQAMELLAELL